MIALTSPTEVENFVSAVIITNGGKVRSDFPYSSVPVDAFEAAIGRPSQWVSHPRGAVLIMVDAGRLLTQIAFGGGMCHIATDFFYPSSICAQFYFDTTVVLALHAGGRVPTIH